MNPFKKTSLFLYGLFISIGFSSAAIINVPSDYASIQSAINASNTGDTIYILSGTYTGNIEIFNKSGLNIIGTGGTPIIIPNDSTIRGVDVDNSYNIIFENLGFMDRRLAGSCNAYSAFFMKIANTKYFTLRNSTLTGGGISTCLSAGIDFNGVQDAIVSNVYITNFYRNGITLSPIREGSSYYTPKNYLFENITLFNNAQMATWAQFAIYSFDDYTTSTGSNIENLGFSGDNVIESGRNGMRIDSTNSGSNRFLLTPHYIAGNGEPGPTGIPMIDLSTFSFKKTLGYHIMHIANNDTNVDAMLTKFYDYAGNLLDHYTQKNQIEYLISHDCEDASSGSGDNVFYHGACNSNIGLLPPVCMITSPTYNQIMCALWMYPYTSPTNFGRSLDTSDPLHRTNLGSIKYTREYANLGLTKTSSTGFAFSGDIFSFVLNITNYGPDVATGITITEQYPTGFTYISSSLVPSSGNNIFTINGLSSGESTQITITGSIIGNSGDTLTNIASVASITPETGTNSNTGSASILVINTGINYFDLGLTKTSSTGFAFSGDIFSFVLNITNYGPDVATGITITEQYPTGFTYISSSLVPSSGNNIFTINGLSSGESTQITITGSIIGNSGDTLTNIASVSAQNESGLVINTGNSIIIIYETITGIIVTGANSGFIDLGLIKTASANSVLNNSIISYTIIITNHGTNLVTGVIITEQYPTGFTYISSSIPMNSGIFNIGDMNSGQTITIIITGSISGNVGQVFTNIASVSSNTPESGNIINTGTVSTYIHAVSIPSPYGGGYNPTPLYTPLYTTTTPGVDGTKIPTTILDNDSVINNTPSLDTQVLHLTLSNSKVGKTVSFALPNTGVDN